MTLLSIPAIMSFVEACKYAGLPSKFAAILAVVAGAVFGVLTGNLVEGLTFGLASSGAYSGIKAAVFK